MVFGFGKSMALLWRWWVGELWHEVLSKITKKPNGWPVSSTENLGNSNSNRSWYNTIPTKQGAFFFKKNTPFLKPNDPAPRRYQHPCSCRRCLRSGNLPVGKVHSCYGCDSPVDGVKITSQQSKQSLSLGKKTCFCVHTVYSHDSHMKCSLSQNAYSSKRDLPHTLLLAPRLVRRQSKTAPKKKAVMPMGANGESQRFITGNAYRSFSYNLP